MIPLLSRFPTQFGTMLQHILIEISKVILQLIFDKIYALFLLFKQKVMTDCHRYRYFLNEIVPAKHKSNDGDLSQFDSIEEITC